MNFIEQKIISSGHVLSQDKVSVESFLNHVVDPKLMERIGQTFAGLYAGEAITKVMTIESSGIAPAVYTAGYLDVPLIIGKKEGSKSEDASSFLARVRSFTGGYDYTLRVRKTYLYQDDRVLFIDDFLASGQALLGVLAIVNQAECELVGAGIVIDKAFQGGRQLAEKTGIRVKALAIINSMSEDDGTIVFSDNELFNVEEGTT